MLDNGDLYIKDTTEHDGSYNFRCHVENTVTKEKRNSRNYARVIVTGKISTNEMLINLLLVNGNFHTY